MEIEKKNFLKQRQRWHEIFETETETELIYTLIQNTLAYFKITVVAGNLTHPRNPSG